MTTGKKKFPPGLKGHAFVKWTNKPKVFGIFLSRMMFTESKVSARLVFNIAKKIWTIYCCQRTGHESQIRFWRAYFDEFCTSSQMANVCHLLIKPPKVISHNKYVFAGAVVSSHPEREFLKFCNNHFRPIQQNIFMVSFLLNFESSKTKTQFEKMKIICFEWEAGAVGARNVLAYCRHQ